MSIAAILKALTEKAIISENQASLISGYENTKPFSVHWELRAILYLGILLFTSGIGMIVYENIDTIGHQAIIATIALLTTLCFYYIFRYRQPFAWTEVKNHGKFYDFILLLGCTLFLALEGYIQFQYKIFGTRFGLAAIIPTLLFFCSAYRFDHRGALSMALTGLASWLGLTIAPASLLSGNNFNDAHLLFSAIILGSLLVLTGWLSEVKKLKEHFTYTYFFLGGNLATIAALVGLSDGPYKEVCFTTVILLSLFFILRARLAQSLIFLLMGVVYAYIAITYILLDNIGNNWGPAVWPVYIMASAGGVIFFFLQYKTFLRIKK